MRLSKYNFYFRDVSIDYDAIEPDDDDAYEEIADNNEDECETDGEEADTNESDENDDHFSHSFRSTVPFHPIKELKRTYEFI